MDFSRLDGDDAGRTVAARFVATLAILVGACILVAWLAPVPAIALEAYRPLFLYPSFLAPEPQERRLFMLFIVLALPVAAGVHFVADRRAVRASTWRFGLHAVSRRPGLVTLMATMLLIVPFVDSGMVSWLLPAPPGENVQWTVLGFWLSAWALPGAARRGLLQAFAPALSRTSVLAIYAVAGVLALGGVALAALRLPSPLLWQAIAYTGSLALASGVFWLVIGSELVRDVRVGDALRVRQRPLVALTAALLLLGLVAATAHAVQSVRSVVLNAPRWTSHFEALAYATSQVMAGRTVLADLPSQYGLFPELLAPILRLLDARVLGFTVVLTALQLLSQLAVLALAFRLIRARWLFLMFAAAFLTLTDRAWAFIHIPYFDPYYQYMPIRLLFPALSLWFGWKVIQTGATAASIAGLGVLGGAAIVWNIDSGVPVAGACCAWLVVRAARAERAQLRASVMLLALHMAAVAATLLAVHAAMMLKADGPLDLGVALRYQDLFYRTGFFMLPMPLALDPWMAVLGLYLLGIVVALKRHPPGPHRARADFILYLSVLGIGLFAYDQGRSHELVLLACLWPSLLLLFLLADDGRVQGGAGTAPSAGALRLPLALPAALVGAVWLWISLFSLFPMLPRTWSHVQQLAASGPTVFTVNAAFIRQLASDGGSVAIVSPHQAVYFLESGTTSALRGPGFAECVLVEDHEAIIAQLLSRRIDHVFLQATSPADFFPEIRRVLPAYEATALTQAGMIHLVPRRRSP